MSNQVLNIVNNIVKSAEQKGVAKLTLDNTTFDGKNVTLNGHELLFFGSYSYLGLEVDKRLKEAAICAIIDYGLQYPSSRIYSTLPIYNTLEKLIARMFNSNVVLTTSLSLGHISVMPVVIQKEDILILDQHVHSSVQDAGQRLKGGGVKVTVLRHNDMLGLEKLINEYSKTYKRIWYAIDGIYSMFGDTAPIKKIEFLMNKYSKLHIYADDAHGASCFGKNGTGWILSHIKLHDRLILSTGMAKAFGCTGGVFIIKDEFTFDKVKNCAGSLIFSGGFPIPVIGASVKSAEIHLSDEIIDRQQDLHSKIRHCHELLKLEGIPNISDPITPIFFIAISRLNAGYSLVKKMINDGFLTNLASFPAVSESCTGVRFTITTHHTNEDIEKLVQALKKNYPLVLQEEGLSVEQIKRAFRKVSNFPDYLIGNKSDLVKHQFKVEMFDSIKMVDCDFWDTTFDSGCQFNRETLLLMESSFSSNKEVESNWEFIYITIKNEKGNLILATFFTIAIVKEDMLSSSGVSSDIENNRKDNPSFLTAKMMLMGTQLSEGDHLYIDRSSNEWRHAVTIMIEKAELVRDSKNINTILFRDFDTKDIELEDIFKGNSFLKIQLPDGHETQNLRWTNNVTFLNGLDKKKRKYVKQKAILSEKNFKVEIKSNLDEELIGKLYNLYTKVNDKSFELNTFNIPKKVFENFSKLEDWEFLILNICDKGSTKIIAMMMSFIGVNSYHPVLIGLDYNYLNRDIYPQMLWQVIKRANELNLKKTYLGYTASQNKRKFGAKVVSKCAYIKSRDNYNQMLLNMY